MIRTIIMDKYMMWYVVTQVARLCLKCISQWWSNSNYTPKTSSLHQQAKESNDKPPKIMHIIIKIFFLTSHNFMNHTNRTLGTGN